MGKGGLDGERYIEKINDLDPEGGKLLLRSRIAGVHQKGKGASVGMEAFLEDETGKQYYNPLHVDPDAAEMMGFKAPILHGLCSLGYTSRAFMKHYCNNDQEFFKAIGLRFASPVLPGQTLVVEMWEDQGGRVILQTKVKETGKVVISNAFGVTTLTPEIKAKL